MYSLAALTSYLGIAAGLIVMNAAKEEQKRGKRYFIALQKIIITLIIIFLFYFLGFNILIFLVSLLILLILFYKKESSYYIFAILGIVFYLSSFNQNLFLLESTWIFIYGLTTASLLINFKKKDYWIIILKSVPFLAVSLLLSFAATF